MIVQLLDNKCNVVYGVDLNIASIESICSAIKTIDACYLICSTFNNNGVYEELVKFDTGARSYHLYEAIYSCCASVEDKCILYRLADTFVAADLSSTIIKLLDDAKIFDGFELGNKVEGYGSALDNVSDITADILHKYIMHGLGIDAQCHKRSAENGNDANTDAQCHEQSAENGNDASTDAQCHEQSAETEVRCRTVHMGGGSYHVDRVK